MCWMAAETGVQQRRQEIPWSVDLFLSTLGLSTEIESCAFTMLHMQTWKWWVEPSKARVRLVRAFCWSSTLADVSTHRRVTSFHLSAGSYLQRQCGVHTVVALLFFPSVLQEFLRVWHHTQLFAFSGAIRATAHVPKQVRACTAPRACRNVLLSDWLAAVPSSFSWRLLSHYKRSCHDLLCTTTASLCTMSIAQAESKCSLSVSNDNLVTKTELF